MDSEPDVIIYRIKDQSHHANNQILWTDFDMESVYKGTRWWLFAHRWMPEY